MKGMTWMDDSEGREHWAGTDKSSSVGAAGGGAAVVGGGEQALPAAAAVLLANRPAGKDIVAVRDVRAPPSFFSAFFFLFWFLWNEENPLVTVTKMKLYVIYLPEINM